MTTARFRLQKALDRVVAASLAGLAAGGVLAFGGAAWWAPIPIAGLTATLVLAWLAGSGLSGTWRVLKSPMTGLGLLAIGLAAFQSVPVPGRVATAVSPSSKSAHALGMLPGLVLADDPDAAMPSPIPGRAPLTIDRPATLRWLAGASACLAVFWVASHYVDRLERLYLVWGSVVAVFLLDATIALIQLVGQADGLYGFIEPGRGPFWAPTTADALAAPGESALRVVASPPRTARAWAMARPDRPRLSGTMMGGPGAHLALGAVGLPLALALALQLMAPRGSREGLWTRLAESGRGSLLVLLYASTIAAAFLVGLVAGPRLAVPFAASIAMVGLPSLVRTGLGWRGLALTAIAIASMGGGVALGESWGTVFPSGVTVARVDFPSARAVWSDAMAVARDFPAVGVGLGGFAAIQPYYKGRDAASSTAMSSLLQWWAESGLVGMALLAVACAWGLWRLPGAVRRVGTADRALAFGMIGASACFGLVSAVHWTVELPGVALAASAVAGTCNRWLAGATDLFVERG